MKDWGLIAEDAKMTHKDVREYLGISENSTNKLFRMPGFPVLPDGMVELRQLCEYIQRMRKG